MFVADFGHTGLYMCMFVCLFTSYLVRFSLPSLAFVSTLLHDLALHDKLYHLIISCIVIGITHCLFLAGKNFKNMVIILTFIIISQKQFLYCS